MIVFCSVLLAAVNIGPWPELNKSDRHFYDRIFAPVVVAEQPVHTHAEMVLLPNGELRYYGEEENAAPDVKFVYISSTDRGLSWKRKLRDINTDFGKMAYCPWGNYYWRVYYPSRGLPLTFIRKDNGPAEPGDETNPTGLSSLGFFRPLQPCWVKRRLIVGGAQYIRDPKLGRNPQMPTLGISDDDGKTWRQVVVSNVVMSGSTPIYNDKSCRWDNGCCEPTVVELSTGELWMACRASLRHHQLYKSTDGGYTWSGPEAMQGFYASNTMPTFLKLSDGRILFFWNNTEPLAKRDPSEYPELFKCELDGISETVFTNRDVLHVAISEDDGKTWIGFREVALNELRNRADFRVIGNERSLEGDKSVHQSQAMEMPEGKILLAYGQGASKRICIFDLRWIYEKGRYENFAFGLSGLSNFLYLKSTCGNRIATENKKGHCAFNRVEGAALVREPEMDKQTRRECLQICRIRDERLDNDHQGVTWNFPAALRGRLELECRVDGEGFRLSLCDRWINPGDEHVGEYAAISLPIKAGTLGGPGRWVKLSLEWDWSAQTATLTCEERTKTFALKTAERSPFGASYMHLQSIAENHDPKGAYFRSFRMVDLSADKQEKK